MFTIGLTGGIGSGKTTVAELFAKLDVPVIDTDVIARELVQPGEPALAEIVSTFGKHVLNPDGSLDRNSLRNMVFKSTEKRQQLEAMLHPRIQEAVEAEISKLNTPYCIVVIPLLVETQQQDLGQRILVVDCPVELQIQRTLSRDALSRSEVEAIIATQATRQQRLAVADDVIINDKEPGQLKSKVVELHQQYNQLAATS